MSLPTSVLHPLYWPIYMGAGVTGAYLALLAPLGSMEMIKVGSLVFIGVLLIVGLKSRMKITIS